MGVTERAGFSPPQKLAWVWGSCFLALGAAWSLVSPLGTRGNAAFSCVAQVGTIALATGLALNTARRLTGRQRLAWAAIGATFLLNALPLFSTFFYVVVDGRAIAPTTPFTFVPLAALPVGIVGGYALLTTYLHISRLRTLLDALVVAASISAVAWVVLLDGMVETAGNDATPLIPPVMDLIYVLFIGFMTLRVRRDRYPLMLISLGLIVKTVGDFIGAALSLHHAYQPGNITDLSNVAVILLMALAAWVFRPVEDPRLRTPVPTPFLVSFLPYAAVVLAALAIAGLKIRNAEIDGFIVWDSIGLMLLLAARQLTTLRENTQLNHTIDERSTALLASEDRFRELINNSSDIIAVLDEGWIIRSITPAISRLLGIEPAAVVDKPLLELVHPDDVATVSSHLTAIANGGRHSNSMRFRVRDQTGAWRMLEADPTNLLEKPSVRGIVLNTRDISEQQALEHQLRHQAFHDPLTGLANRALLHERLQHALKRQKRSQESVVLILLDLDDFKTINDSLGHAHGDILLNAAAQRMLTCLRASDTAARLGGDEFAILIEDEAGQLSASDVAQRLLTCLEQPVIMDGESVSIRASAGVARGERNCSAEDVIRRADVAMYQAKTLGKGRYVVFDSPMEVAAHEKLRFQTEMGRALTGGELELHYQPVIDLRNGMIDGVEALVRWRHPQRGLVPPLDFIPAAEETGLIIPMSRWILKEACTQGARWQADYPERTLQVSVNISARHLQTAGFVDDVLTAVRNSGIAPSSVILEITETSLLDDLDASVAKLLQVKEVGLRVALDDFGTGYSSLGYLRELPVDIVKIDRSFLAGVGVDRGHTELVRAIQALSNSLSMLTTAEGVETSLQCAVLRELAVDHAQGFLFSRPVQSEAIEELLGQPAYPMDTPIATGTEG